MEKRARAESLDPQETEGTLGEGDPKELKDMQETSGIQESEAILEPQVKITMWLDLKETQAMSAQWESQGRMVRREAPVNQAGRVLMVEEAHLVKLETLANPEVMVCRESLVSEDPEAKLDQSVHLELEVRMGTLDQGVQEEPRDPPETRAGEELWVARVNQESPDQKASWDLWDLVVSLAKMVEMDLVSQGPKEERVMRASQDSQDQRERQVMEETMADQDP